MIQFLAGSVQTHVWDSVVCPSIFSLVKQVDRLVAETTAGCDGYFAGIVDLIESLLKKVPEQITCLQTLVKKWNLVKANVFLKLHDYDQASTSI